MRSSPPPALAALLAPLLAGALAGCNLLESDAPAAPDGAGAAAPAPRFGVAALRAERVDLARTGASWYLDWTPEPAPGVELEFVPMVCAYPDARPVGPELLAELGAAVAAHPERYPDGTLFVVGNEIGYGPQRDHRTPERMASDFGACREALLAANPSFRFALGPVILSDAPAVARDYVGGSGGLAYLDGVLEAWRREHGAPIPADFFAATSHVLEGDGVDLGAFRAGILRLRGFLAERGLAGRGVLITEYGVPIGRPGPERIERFLREATAFLLEARDPTIGCPADGGRLVQRFAWFLADSPGPLEKLRLLGPAAFAVRLSQTALFTRGGRLTHLGAAYASAAREAARRAARVY
jgi:hypothetical protein